MALGQLKESEMTAARCGPELTPVHATNLHRNFLCHGTSARKPGGRVCMLCINTKVHCVQSPEVCHEPAIVLDGLWSGSMGGVTPCSRRVHRGKCIDVSLQAQLHPGPGQYSASNPILQWNVRICLQWLKPVGRQHMFVA